MKNKIINLNRQLLDIDDNEMPGTENNIGKIFAANLFYSSEKDTLKFYDWAKKFNKGETVEVDRSDYEKLRDFVELRSNLPIITKAQLLPLLANDKPQESESDIQK
jgi:hypothetical protein